MHDMVTPAVSPQELALRITRLLARKREGDRMRASVQDGLRLAVIDPLTGLHNRRYGIAQLSAICDRARKASSAFAVMVVDLDRFKSVNDRWGHAAGDDVLVEVAARLARNLRGGDLLARIGGEEFLIALPDTTLAEAGAVAERLCQVVEQTAVTLRGGGSLRVTVSIGLAISTEGETPLPVDAVSDIVNRADRALLVAKTGGRNQVTIAGRAA
jgi:two-component system cell cycle response regulator